MIENIVYFFKHKTKNTTKRQISNIEKFLTTIMDFHVDGQDIMLNKEDETLHRSIDFVKNSIYNLVNVVINMIINKKDMTDINIPAHWKLSQRHNKDIKTFLCL